MKPSHRGLAICLVVFLIATGVFMPAQSYGENTIAQTALYPVCKEDKWGYIDRLGHTVIPFQYAYAGEFRGNGYAMVSDFEGNDGIILADGSYVVYPVPIIDERTGLYYYGGKDTGVFWLSDGLSAENATAFFDVVDGYLSEFCLDIFGQDPWFDGECSDLLRVTYDGKHYGYVNRHTGEQVIPCIYEQMNTIGFHHGFAIEWRPGSDWRLGTEEQVILREDGSYLPLPDGLVPSLGALFEYERILVQDTTSKLYGYCDTQGDCVIPPQYEEAKSFCGGYASVCMDGRWFHIDTNGVPMCPALFERPYNFVCDRATTWQNGLQVIIDPHGTIIKTFDHDVGHIDYLPQGIALFVEKGYAGIIDSSGTELLSPSKAFWIDCWDSPDLFSENKQAFMDAGGKWGFIDVNGQICEPCQWDMAANYINGLATVMRDGIMYKIDHEGTIIWSGEP